MIAAKAMDPVVGVDIHIIQPPGPVPPVPVPHPFVGMILDPMDFAPVVGATVMVNGMPRATAGTGAMAVPPHIPIGGVFVKPPANEGDVFLGSQSVVADGDPLARLGSMVLTCHDVGMMAPPRVKKKRKPKSMSLPTSVLLAIPGAPVLVGGPPVPSAMALGMKAGMAALGAALKKVRGLQKGSAKVKALSDRVQSAAKQLMERLGVPPSVQNLVHKAICTVTGHPVDVATGKVFTEAADFEVDGPLPLRWERTWYSSSTYDGPLGRGWHHAYDLALLADDAAVAVRLADGRGVRFPPLAVGDAAADAAEGLTLARERAGYALRDGSGRTYRFAPPAAPGAEHLLASVEAGRGAALRFARDPAGRLSRVSDATGRVLAVVTSDARGRITAVQAPRPDVPAEFQEAVRYEYSAEGDLVTATDALGQPFRYAYAGGLLALETDRRGYSFHFRYDGEGPGARCVATWGEDGLYAVSLTYQPDRTLATFDDGGVWTYRHGGTPLVSALVDPYGGVTAYERDEAGRVVREVDPNGDATAYAYDGDGPEAPRVLAVGHPTAGDADAASDRPDDPDAYALPETAQAWEYGRMVPPDAGGGPDAWIASQLPAAVRDALGAARRAPGGEAVDVLDRLGRLVERRHADGSRERWAYDPEANVIAYADRDGAVTRSTYGSRSLLVAETDALGHTQRFEYSRSDELTRFVDAGGTEHAFAHDLKDRNVEIRANGRPTDGYAYDAADHLVERRDGGGTVLVRYEIGPGGVDLRRTLAATDGGAGAAHEFAYDDRRRRTLARVPGHAATFAYHADGTLTADLRDGAGVEHAVDDDGTLTRTTYFGRYAVAYAPDPADAEVRVVTDPTGREHRFSVGWGGEVLKRLADGARELACFDGDGRCVAKATWRGDAPSAWRERRFTYSPAGDLREAADSARGVTRYAYDAAHRLAREERPDGSTRDYAFDAAGNLLRQPGLGGVLVGQANQLLTANGADLSYDQRGHLAARRDAGGEVRYRYDALDRLIRIERPDGVWEARYDALGRRVSKTWQGQATEYWWDDFRLAAERRADGSLRVYAYPDHVALAPFLFVEYATADAAPADGRPYYVFADHRGAPERVEDVGGRVVWAAEHDPFGAARVTVDGGVDMPLRMPGHYYDAETGLHYNRFRYYSPELGRYLQADPLGFEGSPNLYAYSANPLVEVDIDGLAKSRCGGKPKKAAAGLKTKAGPKKKAPKKPRNYPLAGKQHPVTGIRFDAKGYPIFPAKGEVQLPKAKYTSSDAVQFRHCNKELADQAAADATVRKRFTKAQLDDLSDGVTPDGFTWHHHQDPGRMQLVRTDVHAQTGHSGGRDIWGGGSSHR